MSLDKFLDWQRRFLIVWAIAMALIVGYRCYEYVQCANNREATDCHLP